MWVDGLGLVPLFGVFGSPRPKLHSMKKLGALQHQEMRLTERPQPCLPPSFGTGAEAAADNAAMLAATSNCSPQASWHQLPPKPPNSSGSLPYEPDQGPDGIAG